MSNVDQGEDVKSSWKSFHRFSGTVVGILVVTGLLIGIVYWGGLFVQLNALRANGVEFLVDNRSGQSLTNIVITCKGDEAKIVTLPDLAIAKQLIKAYDETGVTIQFEDEKRDVHKQSVGVFISHRYTGFVRIEIQPDFELKVENEAYHN